MTKTLIWGAFALAMALPAAPASAQTAADINRLNAAMQICNSPMGAGVPECAKLGAMTGGLGGPVGGIAGKAGAAGLLGALGAAMGGAAAPGPTAMPAPSNGAALQAALTACIQNAGGNVTAIQVCAALTTAPAAVAAAPPAGMLPTDARAQAAAMGTYGAAQAYQACVAANPSGWQACVSQMGAASNAGLMAAGVSAAQLQAAGGSPGLAGAASTAAPAAAKALMGLMGRR